MFGAESSSNASLLAFALSEGGSTVTADIEGRQLC
jgi:hypothetical protein